MINTTETTGSTKTNKSAKRGAARLVHGALAPAENFRVNKASKDATKRKGKESLAVVKSEPKPVGRQPIVTPALSKVIMAEYNVLKEFKPNTAAWVVRSRSGGARILDILPIAKHLRNKATEYIGRIPDAVFNMPTGTKEEKAAKKAALDKIADKAKAMNAQWNEVWRATDDGQKADYLKVARTMFFDALSDYLKVTRRLSKVDSDKRFRTASIGLNMTQSGVVAIQRKSVHLPVGHKATESYWLQKERDDAQKAINDAKAAEGRIKAAEAKAEKEKQAAKDAADKAKQAKVTAKAKAKPVKRTAAELAELKAVGEKIAKAQLVAK